MESSLATGEMGIGTFHAKQNGDFHGLSVEEQAGGSSVCHEQTCLQDNLMKVKLSVVCSYKKQHKSFFHKCQRILNCWHKLN